jgi:hypothetical protein
MTAIGIGGAMASEARVGLVRQRDRRPSLLVRIAAEYLRLPALALTVAQGSRLWGIDATTCEHLLNALVGAGFLRRRADGRYAVSDRPDAALLADAACFPGDAPLASAKSPDAA